MKIVRKEEIIENLYTKGHELQLDDKKDKTQKPNFYVGPYHTKRSQAFVGATVQTGAKKLKPIIYDRNVFAYNKLQPKMAKAFPGIISMGASITPNDEDAGFFIRYFAKQLNSGQIFEIDKPLHKEIMKKKNPHHKMYSIVSLEWKISGPIFNILNKDVIVEHGIIPTNNKSLVIAEQKMQDLSVFLDDSMEYANPREQDNLHTPGDQFQDEDGEEYIGVYHVHMNRAMEGIMHTPKKHGYLFPMSKTIFDEDILSEEEKIINSDSKTYNSLV
jgi:hypothetical protein